MVVGEFTEETQLAVIGAGPGGYVAAFRAADLGIQTMLIDSSDQLGGVCLREGCIPSKALLHVAHLMQTAAEAGNFGVTFEKPRIDLDKLRTWKQSVVERLSGGVKALAGKRKVRVIQGRARFEDSRTLRIEGGEVAHVRFKHAIIAAGSGAKRLPESIMPADCYMDSTQALDLASIPQKLLIVGAGYIGLEIGQVYAALGSRVTVIEALPRIMPGADDDLVRPLAARLKKQFDAIHTSAKLESARRSGESVEVTFTAKGETQTLIFDAVLVAVGREPLSRQLGLENTKVVVDNRGFIPVNPARQTADKRIYAIGDIAGEPLLAHKASHEGIVAAEAIAGQPSIFDARAVPAVAYTSPEVAACGLTEAQAAEQGRKVTIGKFPWGASGRAIAMDRPDGLTKIIAEQDSRRVLGVGIVGEHAGDLIAEAVLAIEMGATAEDLAMTIHPHPTTSETVMEAAETVLGTAIHSLRK
jgi:dihydrolipoamide dehydrogenase